MLTQGNAPPSDTACDSALTAHGVLQTQRLGNHLAKYAFAAIFCSDLQRARRTAQAILDACQTTTSEPGAHYADSELTVLELLREQDFGSLEGTSWSSKRGSEAETASSDHVPVETKASMDKRCTMFIEDYLLPLLIVEPGCHVAVISHGLLLSRLWKCLLARCSPSEVHLASEIVVGSRGLEHLGAWSNTGILDLTVKVVSPRISEPNEVDAALDCPPADEATSGKETSTGTAAADLIANYLDVKVDQDVKNELNTDVKEGIEVNAEGDLAESDDKDVPLITASTYEQMPLSIYVHAVNSVSHLASLKRTRGGIGSAAHDGSQKTLEKFFKRQKTK